ncbi:hypothetical protein [Chitinophaga sp. MM2321]|uniref:hypothetical protein n=1 Tax=Chitinophaga sp. MM2321 TaxID=3137178 RepID=UPI0032D5A2EA
MKYTGFSCILLLLACHTSEKVYTAPAMGAESQFDKGLRPEKHPKYLFDKKMMKDLQKQGDVSGYTNKRRNIAPTIPLPGKTKDTTALPADSSHRLIDSTGTIPLLPDSSRKENDSTHHLPDAVHLPR